MKSYWLLSRLQIKDTLAGLRDAMTKKNGKISIGAILLALLVLFSFGTIIGMIVWLETLLYGALKMANQPMLLIGLTVLVSMVTAALFGLFQTLASMYFNKDAASMAYLPVAGRAVLASKWTVVYITESLFGLGLMTPAMILYGLDFASGPLYWVRAVLILLTVTAIPLSLDLLLSSVLARFTSLTKYKEVWVVLGSLLMVLVVVGTEFSLMPHIPEDADVTWFANLIFGKEAILQFLVGAFPPVMWAMNGLNGQWGQLVLYLLVSLGGMALVLWVSGGSYLETILRQDETSRKAKSLRAGKTVWRQRSPFWAMFRREWNEFLKTPVYLLNGGMGLLMVPIMFIGMYVGITSSEDAPAVTELIAELGGLLNGWDMTLCAAALAGFIGFVNPMVSTAVSREGGRMPIARMMPVPARTQLLAKLTMPMCLTVLANLMVAAIVPVLFGTKFLLASLGALVLSTTFSLATSLVSLTIDAARPMLNWKSEQQVMKNNMNQLLGMVISLLMLALPVVAVVCFGLLMVDRWNMTVESAMYLRFGIAWVVVLLELAAGSMMFLKVGVKKYSVLEP